MTESKRSRFQTKAQKIVTRTHGELEKLKGLTNGKYYDYTEDEVEDMFTYLAGELDEIRSLFRKKEPFAFREDGRL